MSGIYYRYIKIGCALYALNVSGRRGNMRVVSFTVSHLCTLYVLLLLRCTYENSFIARVVISLRGTRAMKLQRRFFPLPSSRSRFVTTTEQPMRMLAIRYLQGSMHKISKNKITNICPPNILYLK